VYHPDHYRSGGSAVPAATKVTRILKVFLVLLIIMLTFRNYGPEYSVKPAAAINIKDESIEKRLFISDINTLQLKPVFFRNSSQVLYFSPQLDLISSKTFDRDTRFSANRFGYITYKKVGKYLKAYNTKGEQIFKYKSNTYPRTVRTKNFYFLLTGDQSGIAFLRRNGHLSGTFQYFTSLLTCYDYEPNKDVAYLGLLDGTLEKFLISKAKKAWRLKIRGSRLSFIKAVSPSPDGEAVSVLSGARPERFTLVSRKGDLLWSVKTGGDQRTGVRISTSKHYCMGNTEKLAYILQRSSGSFFHKAAPPVSTTRRIVWNDFAESRDGKTTILSFSWGNYTKVQVIKKNGIICFERILPSPYAFVGFSRDGQALTIQTKKNLYIYRNANYL